MRVDRDPRGLKPVAEDHIGGLAPDTGQADQVFHARRHLPSKRAITAWAIAIRLRALARKKPVE